VIEYLPPKSRPGHLAHLMAVLQREPEGKATDLVKPIDEIAAGTPRRSLFVLFTDLLVPVPAVRTSVGNLRAAGHDVVVFRVLDPQGAHFTSTPPAMFKDAEPGEDRFTDPAPAASLYRERFAAHAAEVRQVCVGAGADFEQVTTDRPLELVL